MCDEGSQLVKLLGRKIIKKKVHYEVLEYEERINNETVEETCQIDEFLREDEQEENIQVDFGASNVDEQIRDMQSELRTLTLNSTPLASSNLYTNSDLPINLNLNENVEDIYDITSAEDEQNGKRVVKVLKDLNIKLGN